MWRVSYSISWRSRYNERITCLTTRRAAVSAVGICDVWQRTCERSIQGPCAAKHDSYGEPASSEGSFAIPKMRAVLVRPWPPHKPVLGWPLKRSELLLHNCLGTESHMHTGLLRLAPLYTTCIREIPIGCASLNSRIRLVCPWGKSSCMFICLSIEALQNFTQAW